MFFWAIAALLVAIIAGIFGFTDIAGTATMFAKIIFFISIIIFIASLILGRRNL